MKKGLFLFILLTFSCFLYAQETNELVLPPELPANLPASIKESDDYKLAQRYREMAIDAHSVGDYNQSIEYSRQSKEYSDKIILRYGVYEYVLNSQRDAERKLSLFKGVGGDTNELTTTFRIILSNTPPNNADTKKPMNIKAPANCKTRCLPKRPYAQFAKKRPTVIITINTKNPI